MKKICLTAVVSFVTTLGVIMKKPKPNKEAILKINQLYESGFYILIFTARFMGRSNGDIEKAYELGYEFTRSQLLNWGLKFNKLVLGKPEYDIIIDDKAYNYDNNWISKLKKGECILHNNFLKTFSLKNKIAVITGGSGMLGVQHAEAIAEVEGTPILFDIKENNIAIKKINEEYGVESFFEGDVTCEKDINDLVAKITSDKKKIDILINNAALNPDPALDNAEKQNSLKDLKVFKEKEWQQEINVELTDI